MIARKFKNKGKNKTGESTSKMEIGFFSIFPIDVIFEILQHLSLEQLLLIGLASKTFSHLSKSDRLWKAFLKANQTIPEGSSAFKVFQHSPQSRRPAYSHLVAFEPQLAKARHLLRELENDDSTIIPLMIRKLYKESFILYFAKELGMLSPKKSLHVFHFSSRKESKDSVASCKKHVEVLLLLDKIFKEVSAQIQGRLQSIPLQLSLTGSSSHLLVDILQKNILLYQHQSVFILQPEALEIIYHFLLSNPNESKLATFVDLIRDKRFNNHEDLPQLLTTFLKWLEENWERVAKARYAGKVLGELKDYPMLENSVNKNENSFP